MESYLTNVGSAAAEFFNALAVEAEYFAAAVRAECKSIVGAPFSDLFDRV